MRRDLRHPAGICLALTIALTARPPIAHAAGLEGESLDIAIRALEAEGLRIFFSSDLVKPWMRVEAEPDADADPIAALDQMLAPHGLAAEVAANGTVLVVRSGDSHDDTTAVESVTPPDPPDPRPPGPPPLEEVIVMTSRYPLERAGTASATTLGTADIEYQPGLGDDALRAVQRLPGAAANGMSGRTHVRGGEIGETLVVFDGLRLYDPFHLRDFQSVFSVVDPRVVNSMDVYTGAFPAAFGDRLSSVIDVDTLVVGEPLHEVGISFFDASALSAGQTGDRRAQWLVSVRRSNLDLLYQAFSDLPERPRYVDGFAKLSFEVSPALTVTGSVLASQDDLALADDFDREERAEADHRDAYRWLTLDHSLSNGASGRTLLAHSEFDSARSGTSEKSGISAGSLRDIQSFSISSAQSEWSWPIGDDWLLEFGGQLSWVKGRYDYHDDVTYDVLFDVEGTPTATVRSRDIVVDARGRPASAHFAVRRRLSGRLTGDFGLRWDRSSLAASSGSVFGPRIGLRFDLSDATEIRASIGRIHQAHAINELQISDGMDRFLPPQASDHFVVGMQHQFPAGLRLRVEAYQKRMTDLWPRFENLLNSRILLPELKPDRIRIAPESATAIGLEVTVASGRASPAGWWLSYSWSKAEDHLVSGSVLRSWDQPHAFGAGIDWDLGAWRIALAASFRSGWPTTAIEFDEGDTVPVITADRRNGRRLGDYRSLDLLATRTFELERSTLALSFELTNVLDRGNPCCIEYEVGEDDEAGQLLLKSLAYLPLVPSVGVRWSF